MAFVALCLVTACHTEQDIDIPKDSENRMITVHASQTAETRTTVVYQGKDENNNPIYKSIWQAGDYIRLFQVCSHGWAYDASSDLVEDADVITEFQVPAFMDYHEPTNDEQVQYVGISYGYGAEYVDSDSEWWMGAWGDNQPASTWGLRTSIPSYQEPTENSFDRDADLLLSRMVTSKAGPLYEMDLYFARIGSIARITLKGLPQGEKVISGTLEAGESWLASGEVAYDPKNEKVAYHPPHIKGYESSNSSISFEPQDVYVDQSGQAVIWLRTFSGTISDHFSVTVSTKNPVTERVTSFEKEVDLTSFNPARSITFDEGSITAFNVVMEKSPTFKFSQQTLELFPELGDTQHPKLRLPRDYFSSLPIEISSPYEWEMSFIFDDEQGWFGWWDYYWNCYHVYTFYEDYSPYYLRTARMILTCPELEGIDEDYEPIEIPVEEYQIVTVVKNNNEALWNGDWLQINVGESIELTAHIQCPSWISLDENPINWVYDPEDYSVEVESDGLTCTVTGIGEGDDRLSIQFAGHDLFWDESLTGWQAQWLGFYGKDYELYLDYDGKDVTEKRITVAPGEPFTLRADLSGIPEKNIVDADWIVSSAYDWDVEPPVYLGTDFLQYTKNKTYPDYSIDVTAGDEYGSDWIALSIKLNDETEITLYTEVFVSPVRICRDDVNVTGKDIKVAPGEETELTVVIDDAFMQMLEADNMEIGPIHWGVSSGEWTDDDEYVQGTGNPISLTYDPKNPSTAIVSVKTNPRDTWDRVDLGIELIGEDEQSSWFSCDCEFVIATPYPIPTLSKMRRTAPNRRHENRPIYQFKRHSNRRFSK